MSMGAEEYALREGLDIWQVRVDRGFRGEFKAWEGHEESEAQKQFASWCDTSNVDKVGLYVNGNLARPLYIRRKEEQ